MNIRIKTKLPHKLNCQCNWCKNYEYQIILTKKFLEKEYLIEKKSIEQISKEVKCKRKTIEKRLIKFNIPVRNMTEAIKILFSNPKNHPNYIDGRSLRKNYCIDCKEKGILTKIKWKAKRCHSCAQRERLKFHKIDCKCYLCKIKRNEKIEVSRETRQKMKLNHTNVFSNKNPNWKNGESFKPYSFEFNSRLKESIRKRDNYTCQNCNMNNKKHIYIFKYNLTIHHIDYDKNNNTRENLISLCVFCNSKANGNRDYWKNYYQNIINKNEKPY